MTAPFAERLKRYSRYVAFYRASSRSKVILSAGMPRSGSTWLFNAARLLLTGTRDSHRQISSGWIEDLGSLPKSDVMLIKTHTLPMLLAQRSYRILYSYRDLRDALASKQRMFGDSPTLDAARSLIDLDQQWRNVAHFTMRYETMMKEPLSVLNELADTLDVRDVDLEGILHRIDQLGHNDASGDSQSYNTESLLHHGHKTDGRHGSWMGQLEPDLVKRIEQDYRDWFVKNNYPAG